LIETLLKSIVMIRGILITASIFFGTLLFGQHSTIDSGYAEVNNTRLYYEIAGEGQAIVLIHGSFGDHRFWDFQLSALSKKYKVLRYDLRGFGKSALPKEDEVYRDCDDLLALLNYLKIERAHVCGLSYGSFIAIDFALEYPQKCLSLISIGPRVAGDDVDDYKANSDSFKTIIAKTIEILKNAGKKEATDFLWAGDNSLSKSVQSSEARNVLLKMGYEYSWWRHLHPSKREYAFPQAIKHLDQIKMPTLIVTADFDVAICKQVAATLRSQIRGSKFISMGQAGHVMNMDRPEQFNNAISKFIRKQGKFTGTEIGL
jgi:pimeloyl-ACP methyl ester carboxylesterase